LNQPGLTRPGCFKFGKVILYKAIALTNAIAFNLEHQIFVRTEGPIKNCGCDKS
jgi:hypothetical protein